MMIVAPKNDITAKLNGQIGPKWFSSFCMLKRRTIEMNGIKMLLSDRQKGTISIIETGFERISSEHFSMERGTFLVEFLFFWIILYSKNIFITKKKKIFAVFLKVCIGIVSEIEASNDLFLLSVTSWNVLHHCHFPRRKHINFSGYEDHAKPIFMVMFEFFLVNLSAYLT